MRSRMFTSPLPDPSSSEVEPDPGVVDLEAQERPVSRERHDRGRVGAGVLDDVLNRLEAAEVHRDLELLRVPPDSDRPDRDRERGAPRGRAERLTQAASVQQRRIDAAREQAKLLEDIVHLAPDRRQRALAPLRVLLDRLRRHVELDPQTHEVLLDAVVEVALEPPALGVGHLHQPDPRGRQVGRRRLEIRLEPGSSPAGSARPRRRPGRTARSRTGPRCTSPPPPARGRARSTLIAVSSGQLVERRAGRVHIRPASRSAGRRP